MKLKIEVPDNTEIVSITAITAEDTEKGVNISTKVFVQTLHEFENAEDGKEEKSGDEEPPWE